MASMWRRAMVYLGLQDDDELDYGGDYEPYGDYGDPGATRARRRAATTTTATTGAGRPPRTVPGSAATPARCGATRDYGPDPRPGAAPAARATSRRSPRPARRSCARSAPRPRPGCTSSSPQGFNDAQEVGDRLKANQPVILNLQGLAAGAPAAPDRLLERPRVRGGRHDAEGQRPGVPPHAERRRGLPGGEGAAAGAWPVPGLTVRDCHRVAAHRLPVILAGRAVLSWFPVQPGTFLASLNSLLSISPSPSCARSGGSSRRRGCSTCRSSSCSSCS